MKTTVLCFLFSFICALLTAQAPQSFKYQAVARNTTGEVLANKPVSFRISILSGSISGTTVYSEIHQKTTNAFGLVDLEIGKGNSPMGNFNSIDWGGNTFFFKVEMDPAGGTAYQLTGTSQLLSVPYALHAKTVESVATDGTLSGKGSPGSPLKLAPQGAVAGQVLKWNGSGWQPSDDLSGGASAPGGSNGQLQFNSNGVLGGDPGLVWDNTGKRLGIGTGNPAYPLHLTTSGNMGILSESSAADGHGIFGYSSSTTGNNTGVLGESASSSGTGVYGNNTAATGATTGVTGNVTSPKGRGVIGSAGAKTGNAIGVVGYSASGAGTGVLGLNDATGGTTLGVSGMVSSPEGYSGFFSGGMFRVESLAMIDSILSMENHMISNVANPVNPRDAATKEYVDAMVVWIYSLLTAPVNETVRDASGNVYRTVKIGNQVWMAENLKTTKYNDGTAIPLVTDNAAWEALTTHGYCWYDNSAFAYLGPYGALYNWYTVKTGKLCPAGWHVPSDEEWTTLTTFLGGEEFNGGKMKEAGTAHWASPNTGATNETGFSALPGGFRHSDGGFRAIGYGGFWWSSTEYSSTHALRRYLNYENPHVHRFVDKKDYGLSVRCVRDL